METRNYFEEEVQRATGSDSFLNDRETTIKTGTGKIARKFILAIGLAGFGIFLNSCMVGYVATEPVYVEYTRPAPPASNYIWINGDWGYNRQNHMYVQKSGYWKKQNQKKTYVAGHWEGSQRGKYWVPGQWQRMR
jgi:hypothetical protein